MRETHRSKSQATLATIVRAMTDQYMTLPKTEWRALVDDDGAIQHFFARTIHGNALKLDGLTDTDRDHMKATKAARSGRPRLISYCRLSSSGVRPVFLQMN